MSSEPARAVVAVTRQQIVTVGWTAGSSLEDRVAWQLWHWGFVPAEVAQQYRVLSYRLDFAWVSIKVALEVDGPRHCFDPATARRDAERDARLRAQGWLVLRVDDSGDERAFTEQLLRVVQVVRALDPSLGRNRDRAGLARYRMTPADHRAHETARRLAIDNEF